MDSISGLNCKLEFRNPTGSFRDRAAALIISDVIAQKKSNIITISSGSFSISTAAYASRAGINSTSIVPHNIELSKIEQMKIYGSKIIYEGKNVEEATKGYQKRFDPEFHYAPEPNQNILTIEGQKTIGLEIGLQNPTIENIIVPRGTGTLLYSIHQGLLDAKESGWIDKIPRFFAVSLKKSSEAHLVESLDSTEPLLLEKIQQIINQTDGQEMDVTASKMTNEALTIAKKEGIFIEPASASVLAACRKLKETQDINMDQSVAVLTGSGMNAMNIFATQLRQLKKVVWGLSSTSTKKFEILSKIAEDKAYHGYGIWTSLHKKGSIQSIYQHLANLEEEKLIINTSNDEKKAKFILTERGREVYLRMKELLDLKL